jgi:GDP/UDP-N,N'-diacetylbacillosamine 2-epimerase (hydrolysing)
MNIGIITTSRADFGIYLPLIQAIAAEKGFNYFIFAGGMHTSEEFGNSYKLIEAHGFKVCEKLKTLYAGDSPEDIARSMGKTTEAYAQVWKKYVHKLDLVFALGDRFEMMAAASSLIPFNIPLAHLHGGETTLGAIDNKYRHALSCFADYHFTSNEVHAKKVIELTGSSKGVYNVGALGVDSIKNMQLFSKTEFEKQFKFSLQDEFILCTYHPETRNLGANKSNAIELIKAFKAQNKRVLCTLPNADTEGKVIRELLLKYEKSNPSAIKCFENLGQKGYLSAMKYCCIMVGNTSSGIIESTSFGVPVVNVGSRQEGRLASNNVIHVKNKSTEINKAIRKALELRGKKFKTIYGSGDAASAIIKVLKTIKIVKRKAI